MAPGLELLGWVDDPKEQGIEGALVELYRESEAVRATAQPFRSTLTNVIGIYHFTDLPPGRFLLRVTHADFHDWEEPLELRRDAEPSFDGFIELAWIDRVNLAVEVLGDRGMPIAGARVDTWFRYEEDHGPTEECVTGADGVCVVLGVEPRGLVEIRVKHGRYSGSRLVAGAEISAADSKVSLRLQEAPWDFVEIFGTVRDESGQPVPAASIDIYDYPAVHVEQREATTDAAGRYRVEALPEGVYVLVAEAEGFATERSSFKLLRDAPEIDFELPRGATISGRVPGYQPSGEARVLAWEADRETGESSICVCRCYPKLYAVGQIDEDGRFRIPHVAAGFYEVRVDTEAEGYSANVEIVEGQQEARIDLQPTPPPKQLRRAKEPIPIRVVASATGENLVGATLSWLCHDAQGEVTACAEHEIDEDGLARSKWVSNPRREFVGLRAELPGYAARVFPAEVSKTGTLEIRLDPSPGLDVELRWSDGTRLLDGWAGLIDADGRTVTERFFVTGEGRWDTVPRGEFTLRISHSYGEVEVPVTIPGPAVVVEVPPTGAVQARVLDLDLEGVEDGVATTTIPLTTDRPATTRTVDGTRVTGLEPGLWQVEVRAPGGRLWTSLVDVSERRESQLFFRR